MIIVAENNPIYFDVNYDIMLASNSPRRKELLTQLGIAFKVVANKVDETFPSDLDPVAAVRFIAQKKASAFVGTVHPGQLLIAADTIVVLDGDIMGKPTDEAHATALLKRLSGRQHQVITAVAILGAGDGLHLFHEITDVYFRELTANEIAFYITHYQPYDKAGAYGIQEWIGLAAIEKISGSYTNVVGLPTAALYESLQRLSSTHVSP